MKLTSQLRSLAFTILALAITSCASRPWGSSAKATSARNIRAEGSFGQVVTTLPDGTRLDAPIKAANTTISDTRINSVVAGGSGSDVSAGERGVAVAGFTSNATAGREGIAYVRGGTATCIGSGGIAITRAGGKATAQDTLALALRGGTAVMTSAGVAIAINDPKSTPKATAQAGLDGLLVLGYFENGRTYYVTAVVDGTRILANTPYKLDRNHLIQPASIIRRLAP